MQGIVLNYKKYIVIVLCIICLIITILKVFNKKGGRGVFS